MADFIAQIKAQVNTKSFQSELRKLANETPVDVKTKLVLSDIDTNGIESKVQSALDRHKFTISISNIKFAGSTAHLGDTVNSALAKQVQYKIDTRQIDASISDITKKFNKLNSGKFTFNTGDAESRLESIGADLAEIQAIRDRMDFEDDKELVKSYAEISKAIKTAKNELKELADVSEKLASADDISTFGSKLSLWKDNNSKALKQFGGSIELLETRFKELASSGNMTSSQLQGFEKELRNIDMAAKAAGVSGKSFGQVFKESLGKLTGYFTAYEVIMRVSQATKQAVQTVVELDDALVDLQKTTTASADQLNKYYYDANDIAKQYGATTKDIIQSTADWSRLGFNLQDSQTMAKVASQFKSISPGMDMETATSGLVSIMKAFDISAEDALDGIASKINKIGNTAATSNTEIVTGLEKSSAAMAAMGTSFDETVALFTAGQEIIQDSSRMGNALRTVGMRLRGYNEETEELDDGLKNIAGDLYDLTTVAGKGGVSIFTDETQQHYKSVYQYLGEIADRWEELSEVQRQGFLNKAFAKTRASEGAAIISNFKAARKAIDDMAHSANSANDEMEVITGSLTYKLNALKETGVGIAQNLFARKDIGIIIDGATKILEVIDALTDKLGLFGSLAAGVMIGDLVKNFSKLSGVATAVKTLGGAFNTLKLTSSIASTSGLGTAFTELASAIGVSTTALGVFASATGVLVGVLGALALDKLIVNASEANDIMSESADKFKSAKDNVVSLREELRNNNQAIRELNDGTPLTFVEQDELAKLKETNGELRESIKLANEQQEESRKQLAEDSLSAYRKNFKELVDEQKVASRLEAPDLFLDSSSMTNLTDTIALLRRIEELRESSGDEFAYADVYKEGKESLREQLNLLSEYKKNLEDAKEYGTITSEQENALKEIGAQMDFIYKELGDITWQAEKLDAFFGVDSMNALKNELVDLSKSGKLTIDAFSVDKYKPIQDFLDSIGMDWQSFIDDINAGAIDVDSMQRQIKDAFATDETSKQWNDFLSSLTDEDIEIIYELMKSGGADSFSIRDFKDYLDNLNKQSVEIPVKFNFEEEAKKVANVSTALANSLSNTGISIIDSEDTKSDLTNIRQTYGALKGYDESKLFENTANGIHLNREELRKLNIEYEKQNKSVLSKELLSATMEYEKQNRALMKIANTQSVEYEKQLEIVEGAKAEVDAINLKISAYNGLTSVYKKYQDSLSLADERAGYEAINSGYDSVKKLIAQGWAGDEEVRQYVDLLTSGSQQDWTAQELAKRFKELSKNKVAGKFKVTDFFTVDDDGNSTSKGIKNFFDAIIEKQKEVGENWVQLTGEKYEFNFDNQKVADALGVDIELVEQLVKAGSEAGLSLNMNDAVEVMTNLSEKIRESDAELEKLGKNPVKVNFDTNDYDSEISKLQGKLSKLDEGSKTYENVSLKLQKLVELKLEAEQPAYMKLDVSAFEGSAKTALTALQEYGRAVENLNRQKILSPKADTTELRKAVHEAAKNIKKLSDEEKLSIGIDPSWDLKTIKEKLQTGEITIPLTADTEQVKESVRTMISELQNYEISFKTVDDGSIKMFINEIDSSNPQISVGVSGMDEVEEYRKLIKEIPDGKNVNVVASTKGDKEVNTLTKDVNKVPNRKVTVKAETKGEKYVSNLHKAVANLNSKTITVTTNVRGAGEIASLKRLWSDIRNKNVTLTTTTTKVTRYKNIGTVQAYGSARNGNAYVRGKWGIPRKSHALVGERGREIFVNPNNGTWQTVGDAGAEFIDLPKNAIIFNNKQTEQLLKYGKIQSRGKAFAGGTIGSGSFVDVTTKSKTKSSSTKKSSSKSSTDKKVEKAASSVEKASKTSEKATKETKSNLEKFQGWVEKFIDWIEVRISYTTNKIEKFVARAELATERGNYNSASKNYRKAMNSTYTLMDEEQKASAKYQKFANDILKKAVATGALSSGQVESIKKKVASGSISIEEYSEQVRGVISEYQEWAEKAKTAKEAITSLQSNIDSYISSLKELRDTQRDAKIGNIENLTSIGTSGNTTEYNTQVANSQLTFTNSQLNKQAAAYAESTRNVASDVNAIGKQATKYVNADKKGASKAYKSVLNRIKSRIAKKLDISSKDLGAVKKRNSTLYNRLVAYNMALDNLEIARMEESMQYAEVSAEIYSNIAETYSNRDKVSENNISLYRAMVDNASGASSKNDYLAKVLDEYAKIQANNEAEISKYSSSANEASSIISRGRSQLVGGSYSGLSDASKKKVMSAIESAKSAVKKGVAIPTSVLAKIGDYYSKGYVTRAFYRACIDYNNAMQMKAEAEARAEIDRQTYIEQRAAIGSERFENVETDYANKRSQSEQAYDLLSSKADLATARGQDITRENYEQRINYLKEQQQTYNDEIESLKKTIKENVDTGLWTTSSQEYLDAIKALNDYRIELKDAQIAEEELKDELRDDVLWRVFDDAHESAERFSNILSGITALLDSDMFFDSSGNITEYGVANLGELVKQYQNAQKEVENFSNDIENLNNLYADGWYTQDEYDSKLNELQTSMLESASDMKGYIDNIKAMYKELDQQEINSLKELVDARKDALESKKSYYDYDKTLKSKTKDLQELNAQLVALEGINTADARRKRAEIQASIQEAEEDLEDTVRDHNYELIKSGLDGLQETIQNQFDEKWENLSTDLESIAELLENANALTAESATKTNETINKLLEFYGISTGDTGINVDRAYASGTRKVPYDMKALTNERGNEIIVTKDGMITPLKYGDGIIPSNLTDRLYNMAQRYNIKENGFAMPYVNKAETTVNQTFDSLIHIDGSADAATVEDLKRMQKDLLETSYKYTSDKMWKGYMKSGGKRVV